VAGIYGDIDAFFADLGDIYAQQIKGLAAIGCTYLQLDEVPIAMLGAPEMRARVTGRGGNGETQHVKYIRLMNRTRAKRPDGMTASTHLCRGNCEAAWAGAGGDEPVAEALFGQLDVDGFCLEYDDDGSGDFAPLRYVPRGKKRVVLGIVTSKKPALEAKDELK